MIHHLPYRTIVQHCVCTDHHPSLPFPSVPLHLPRLPSLVPRPPTPVPRQLYLEYIKSVVQYVQYSTQYVRTAVLYTDLLGTFTAITVLYYTALYVCVRT